MLLNYLKLSFRLMARDPFFTAINLAGLSIALTCFYVLWNYAWNDLKSDQFHKDFERMGRLGINWNWTDDGGNTWDHHTFGFGPGRAMPSIQNDFAEVESTCRLLQQSNFMDHMVGHGPRVVISVGRKGGEAVFKETRIIYADSNLFSFFTLPLVHGDKKTILSQSNYAAISESTSIKYFGHKNPVGEFVRLNDSLTLMVSGVFRDLPHNSHLNFDIALSTVGILKNIEQGLPMGGICYLKLNEPQFEFVEAELNKRVDKYIGDVLRANINVKADFYVQPLADIPFSQYFVNDIVQPKSRTFLIILAFVAVSILVMAWINYVNLTVSRTTKRYKEIATRKVSGALGRDLLGQFLTEAFCLNVLAIALASTILQFIRQPFQALLNFPVLPLHSLSTTSILILIGAIITGVLLTGIYPAYISITQNARMLFKPGRPDKRLVPSMLFVAQISVAVIFISLGVIISLQLTHILSMETGIKKENAISIESPVVRTPDFLTQLGSLKKEILKISGVTEVSASKFYVHRIGGGDIRIRRVGADVFVGLDANAVDASFLPFYGLRMASGRNFKEDDNPDAIILSRHAIGRIGITSPEDALNTPVEVTVFGSEWRPATIVGVIENFRNTPFLNVGESNSMINPEGEGSLLLNPHQTFAPYFSDPDFISVRISSTNLQETISEIQEVYENQFPGAAFSWNFVDEAINEVYTSEKVARNQVNLFSCVAILIASLGLLGIITNRIIDQTKEIGVRKVLGARTHHIFQRLLNSTASQLIVASVIAMPISYYLVDLYLERYSERISLHWWHFTLPVMILAVILLCTVVTVVWKAANSNPVEALKYE